MILILEFEDGGEQPFGIGDTVQSLIRAIERNEVSRIVVGETKDRKVIWEKQFESVTVMPSSFGKPSWTGGRAGAQSPQGAGQG